MSSHHIIREDQEPALLICEYDHHADLLFQLLEWSPKVIVLEPAITSILDLGIKIDVAIFHADALRQMHTILELQAPLELVTADRDTDLVNYTFQWMAEKNVKGVHVMGSVRDMSRIPASTEMEVVLFEKEAKWIFCKKGMFRKWVKEGHQFFFRQKTINNLSIYLDDRKIGVQGTELTVPHEGFVELKSKEPFWLGEPNG